MINFIDHVVCQFCGNPMIVSVFVKGAIMGVRGLVYDHGALPEGILEMDGEIFFCPNNGKMFIVNEHGDPREFLPEERI